MILNTSIAKQPLNWLTIFLMLFIAAIAGHLVLQYFGVEPATADSQ